MQFCKIGFLGFASAFESQILVYSLWEEIPQY
jgi:hypothetical protein